eukprot:12246961-Prorocentrum_lima.AAC.1
MGQLLAAMDAAIFLNRCEGGTNLVAMEVRLILLLFAKIETVIVPSLLSPKGDGNGHPDHPVAEHGPP